MAQSEEVTSRDSFGSMSSLRVRLATSILRDCFGVKAAIATFVVDIRS